MAKPYLAHSAGETGSPQELGEHLRNVATITGSFAEKFGAGQLGYWAGLWHDLGKIHPDWQAYLRRGVRSGGPDHKGAGAVYALERAAGLAPIILGHHGGLKDMADATAWLKTHKGADYIHEAIKLAESEWPDLVPPHSLPSPPVSSKDPFAIEFFIRFLFSSLVDADRLDTEAHAAPTRASVRQTAIHELPQLWHRLGAFMDQFSGKRSDLVGRIRHEIYEAAKDRAMEPQGFFRLTAPTGGGKTLSSLAFALKHATVHGLDRVIIAIPYTSIIEQTVDTYRAIFGEKVVLEHHSSLDPPDDPENLNEGQLWAQLSAENWDAPIVVTTTVQLFESLLSNKTSRCRKLHNIARSVLVLDEVQTLPPTLLAPILDVLRQLVANYGVSVLLCTATQPALAEPTALTGLPNLREVAPDPDRLFRSLRRVKYEFPALTGSWSWSRVAEEMWQCEQVLVIVNTRADAQALLDGLCDPEALHLSTLLCGAHRRDVLAEVHRRLRAGEACRLVSTQVVEAGVDLDFPVVLRALGPLDRIVQAAGRCNREGRLPGQGRVVVFKPTDGGLPPGSYKTATQTTETLLVAVGADGLVDKLHEPGIAERYFQVLYQNSDLDLFKIQALRRQLKYEAVGATFRMIPDDTVPVFVHYEGFQQEHRERLQELRKEAVGLRVPGRSFWRRLQPYLVQVRRQQLRQYENEGLVAELRPGLFEWLGRYDLIRGLVATTPDPNDLIW